MPYNIYGWCFSFSWTSKPRSWTIMRLNVYASGEEENYNWRSIETIGIVIRNSFSAKCIIWWFLSHRLPGDKKSCSLLDDDNSQILGGTLLILTLYRSPESQICDSCLFWVIGNISGERMKKVTYFRVPCAISFQTSASHNLIKFLTFSSFHSFFYFNFCHHIFFPSLFFSLCFFLSPLPYWTVF